MRACASMHVCMFVCSRASPFPFPSKSSGILSVLCFVEVRPPGNYYLTRKRNSHCEPSYKAKDEPQLIHSADEGVLICGCWVCLGKPEAFICLSGLGWLVVFNFWNVRMNVSISQSPDSAPPSREVSDQNGLLEFCQ